MPQRPTVSRPPSSGKTGRDKRLTNALAAARAAPEQEEAWSALEALAAENQSPDEVAELYREVLARDLPQTIASRIAERALRFHEEWFGETDPGIVDVLSRTLELDPSAEWAFERLTVLYTVSERWKELLALYDRALASTATEGMRARLLQDAAHHAKDFAGEPERAIGYLEELIKLRPADAQVASSLERLLERSQRWPDLVALWRARLASVSPEEAGMLRGQIATCLLDRMDEAAGALGEIEQSVPDETAMPLLERLLALETAPAAVRRGALASLRARYEALGRADDLLRVLDIGQSFEGTDQRLRLHREAGERLLASGSASEAMDHYASILGLDPADHEAEARLRWLAARTERHADHVNALVTAAKGCEDVKRRATLFVAAATVLADTIADPTGAAGLFAEASRQEGADPSVLRTALRRLEVLFDAAGRGEERLAALERLAKLEPRDFERRLVLGQAGRLAEALGDADRALTAWGRILEANPKDSEALGAVVEILAKENRHAQLVQALRARVAADAAAPQRRVDLVRIARLQELELGDYAAALATWLEIREAYGDEPETADALSLAFEREGKWEEQAALLQAMSEGDVGRLVGWLVRLGDVMREHLGAPEGAAARYERALGLDPANPGARAGMQVLLDDDACRSTAVAALTRAFERTGDWESLIAIAPRRLEVARDAADRVRVLRETADLQEQRAGDAVAALRSLVTAFPLAPADERLEGDVFRLAEATSEWSMAHEAVRDAASALPASSTRALGLRAREGSVLEERLADPAAALGAYCRVLAVEPARSEVVAAAIRVAARSKQWDAVAKTLLGSVVASGRLDETLLARTEEAAQEGSGWEALAWAMTTSLAETGGLQASVARDLEVRIALWHRDRRSDPDAAEGALLRAVRHDPRHEPTLVLLADLQRNTPGKSLVQTLLSLAEVAPGDLDPIAEAADVATSRPEAKELAPTVLGRLYDASLGLVRSGVPARGKRAAEECLLFALEGMGRLAVETEDHDRTVELLVERAGRVADPAGALALLHEAAEVCAGKLGDLTRALGLYRRILDAAPDDVRALAAATRIQGDLDRPTEIVALHRHELGLGPPPERRVELRLEIARLLGEAERRGGRVETLRANLDDAPGHAATLEAIGKILLSRNRQADFLEILAEQAARVEAAGDAARAAELWSRAAVLAEEPVADLDRAVECHARAVALVPTVAGFEALTRICLDRNDPAEAAGWLEKEFEIVAPEARAQTAFRLAQATSDAGDADRAVRWLRRTLKEDPSMAEARDRLAALYREGTAWEDLAALLVDTVARETDVATVLGHAGEVVELRRAGRAGPEQAAAILEKAASLAPDDRWVHRELAGALRAAGRLEEAAKVLSGLLESYGRRRSPERAATHLELARVLQEQGDVDAALKELDLAAGMDVGSAEIFRAIAELTRETGQLERSERAYRALLLIVRRKGPAEAGISASEVQLELSRLAERKGESEQAEELLASALATAASSDVEAERFRDALFARGEFEILLRSIETRLRGVEDEPTRALVLSDKARVLDGLDRTDEALDTYCAALELLPESEDLHAAARALAKRSGATDHYVEKLSGLVERFRRGEDVGIATALLIRMGETVETDLEDLGRAAEFFVRAEHLGVRRTEVCQAIARVAAKRGDRAEEVRALRRIETTDALYRLAEVLLASPEGVDEGLAAISAAVEREPDYERALRILEAAKAAGADVSRVLPLHEWVARRSGDPLMLLDFFERRAALPWARVEQVREGIDHGLQIGEEDRAERLMVRAVELARSGDEGVKAASFALVPLAQRRRDAGDHREAVAYWNEAVEVLALDELFDLGLELASSAPPALAVGVYERLLGPDPMRRDVWEPLARAYAAVGNVEGLDRLASGTLPVLAEPADRNLLRMELARLLVSRDERLDEARDMLRDVLMEDPGHVDGNALLADLLERSGDEEDLKEMLGRQVETARERGDAVVVAALSVRLAAFHARSDPEEAKAVLQRATEIAPDDPGLLRARLRLSTSAEDPPNRAELIASLLAGLPPEEAEEAALELADQSEEMGDGLGLRLALEGGHRAAPGEEEIRGRLESLYRELEDWGSLAEMLANDAARTSDSGNAVDLLREASALERDRLGNPSRAAALLREARGHAPTDTTLVVDLAQCLVSANEARAAVDEVTTALDAGPDPAARAMLLCLRAELRSAVADDAGAVEDLEEARGIAGNDVLPALRDALVRKRERAAGKDRDAERSATLRLTVVLSEMGESAQAFDLVVGWLANAPEDLDALLLVRDLALEGGRWDVLVEALARLAALETGAAQVDAALGLVEVCRRTDRSADAVEVLEIVARAQPEAMEVRDSLRELYEETGSRRALATLLMEDALAMEDEAARFGPLRRAGDLLLDEGEAADAVEPLEVAYGLRPDDADTGLRLIDAYTGAKRLPDAEELAKRMLSRQKKKRSPFVAALQLRMARAAQAAGDDAARMDWLKRALETDRNNGDAALELADLAESLGDDETALRGLQALTLMKGEPPLPRATAYVRQARIAARLGEQKRAVLWARRALVEAPGSEDAVALLRELGESVDDRGSK